METLRLTVVVTAALMMVSQSAQASPGNKRIVNETEFPLRVELVTRARGIDVDGNSVSAQIPPGATHDFSYFGPYINVIRVSGVLNCEMNARATRSSGRNDHMLNMFEKFIIRRAAVYCTIEATHD